MGRCKHVEIFHQLDQRWDFVRLHTHHNCLKLQIVSFLKVFALLLKILNFQIICQGRRGLAMFRLFRSVFGAWNNKVVGVGLGGHFGCGRDDDRGSWSFLVMMHSGDRA